MSLFMWYSLLRRYTCNCLFSPQMGSGKKFPPVLAHNLPSVSPQGKLLPGVPQSTLKCRCAQIQIYKSLCLLAAFLDILPNQHKEKKQRFCFTFYAFYTFHIPHCSWHLAPGTHFYINSLLSLIKEGVASYSPVSCPHHLCL